MTVIRGDAGFKYTPSGGSLTTHALSGPIKIESYRKLGRRYVEESEDRSTIQRITTATGKTEILARIPYDDAPDSLVTMINEAANNGVTLTYYPSLADTGTSYAFTTTAEMGDEVEVVPDRQFGGHQYRWEITIRLRTSADISALVEGA